MLMNEHLNAEEIKAFQALSKDEGRSEMVQLFKLLGDATRPGHYYTFDTA